MDVDRTGAQIGLAQAISELRRELSLARQQGKGQDVRFRTGDIELELGIEFGWKVEAGGGFKLFSFLDMSGKAGTSDKSAHKLKLKLTIDDAGSPAGTLIGDEDGPRLPKQAG